jgi:hypothetical protein
MHSRKDYMSKKVTHQEYYGQFVSDSVKNIVQGSIGVDRITNSKDPHFNDIPLKEWDCLASSIRHSVGRLIADANGTNGISLSDCVCTAKAAARIIQTEALKNVPLRQKIQEKFGLSDDCFHSWCSDLYVLTEDKQVKEFAADNGFKSAYFTRSDVEGQAWHGKTFLEIPFAN